MSLKALCAGIVSLALLTGAAHAQVAPPPPPPAGGASGGSVSYIDTSGNRWKGAVEKLLVDGAICAVGGYVIERVSDVKPTMLQRAGNIVVCALVSAAIPAPGVGGLLGLVATQTLCCGPQSIVVKATRPGGFRCQPQDRGKVAGCDIELDRR